MQRLEERLEALKKVHNFCQHRARLVFRTGFQQRSPGNVMPLTPAESELICLLTWQSFDWLLHFLTTASAQQLKEFVAEPEKWQANLPGTAIFARDAVPVYLDAATGKLPRTWKQLRRESQTCSSTASDSGGNQK